MNIVENLILVALKPDKSGFLTSPEALNAGLMGAIFIELSFQKTIEINNNYVTVKNLPNSISNSVDGMLHRIHKSKRPKKVKFWISKFAQAPGKFKKFFLEGLEKKRYIRIDKKKFLFIPYKKISLVNKREREQLLSRLREALLHGKEMTGESASLLGLIGACKLQKALCRNKSELKEIKAKLKKLMNSEQIPHDVEQVIKEMHAAVIAAVTATTGATVAITAASG